MVRMSYFSFEFLIIVIKNPFLSYSLYLILVLLITLSKRIPGFVGLSVIIFPWLLLGLIFLYLPFLYALFQRFSLSKQKKINHVLEHGTIVLLKQHYGINTRISGSSEEDGFFIRGVRDKNRVTKAFNDLKNYLANGDKSIILSKNCGSVVVLSQVIGLILLTFALIIFVVFDSSILEITIVLFVVTIIYTALRHKISLFFQDKLFMSFAFKDAHIKSISEVKKKKIYQKRSQLYVRTQIVL
jgi:uncharacterized protein DUF6391